MCEQRILSIDESSTGLRLDVFLTRHFPQRSRTVIQRWIEDGLVTVNQESVRSNYRLRQGDSISVSPAPAPPSRLEPEDIPVNVVYEDQWIVVIDKPAGLVVHPGAGNLSGTLANALMHRFGRLEGGEVLRPGIVHRLDKLTSGLLVVARTEEAHLQLSRQFKERRVEKQYLALVYGRLRPVHGEITVALGRHPRIPTRMSIRGKRLREARTSYDVLQTFKDFSLVKVKLQTGRTHQIRVHFQHLGHPVVGDETYGAGRWKMIANPRVRDRAKTLGRYFLHACSLGFEHPAKGEWMEFNSPLPEALQEFLKGLD